MRILFTGDWHLDASTSGFSRRNDLEAAADHVVDEAIARSVDLFLFLGDLCDPTPYHAPRSVAYAIELARQLQSAGIPSRWITGNHDVIDDGFGSHTLLPLAAASDGKLIRVVAEPCVETFLGDVIAGDDEKRLDKVTLVYLPYTPRARSYDAKAFVEGIEPDGAVVFVGHLMLDGMHPGSETLDMPRGRDMRFPLETIGARFGGSPYWMLNGHYHRRSSDDSVLIPGALERLTFGDENDAFKGFGILNTIDPDCSVEWFGARDSRRLVSYEMADLEALGDDWQAPSDWNVPARALVRLYPEATSTSEDLERAEARLKELGAAHVVVQPRPPADRLVVQAESAPAPRLSFRAEVEATIAKGALQDELRGPVAELCGEIMDKEGL